MNPYMERREVEKLLRRVYRNGEYPPEVKEYIDDVAGELKDEP